VVGATLAGIEPTVLVIDDLHWADATLWLALDGFADGFVLGGGLVHDT
jgi:predicted ATPase